MDEGNRRPMRVCHLGKFYPPAPGGIETHVRTLARAQAALGTQVQVVCTNHADLSGNDVTWSRYGATETALETDDLGVRICRLGRSAHFAKLDFLPDLRQFFRRLKDQPVDVIHLHTPNPTMLLAVAALRPWAPLVITHHSDVVKQRKMYWAFAPFERLVYDRASRIISNSPDYIAGSTRLLQQQHKVVTLPMGIDLAPFLSPSRAARAHADALRRRYQSAGPLWLCVGRCVYYKGYDTAIRALREVPGTLMIVGQGPYKNHLMHAAKELGVADRIVWRSYMSADELIGAYHAATALWLPSNLRSEPFGLTIIEAMACGRATIISRAGGAAELFTEGYDAIGVTPGDPAALADAILKLVGDPQLRQRLEENARLTAVERFNPTGLPGKIRTLYAMLTATLENRTCGNL
jgi:glycosyltransferase involved in cell wall biosynthesis